MTAPAVKVLVGFNATASLGNNFVLNDPTKGKLNSSTYTLAGSVFVDVSQWVSGQVSTNRGRSREVDQYQAGSLAFTLRNEDRRFDPSNSASPYAPGIQPRNPVIAFLDGVQIFAGYVEDYNVQYEKPNICTVAVTCLDGFIVPSNTYLFNYTGAAQQTGARINAILDTIGYPASRNIDTGLTALAAGGLSDRVHAIDDLQMAARSENGYLFVDRFGVLTFRNRYYMNTQTISFSLSDTGTGIPYQGISQKSQALLLYNQATGQRRLGGTRQEAQDLNSVAEYLPRELLIGQLDNATDADVLNLCEYLVSRYSQPDVRFDTITIELQGLSPANRAAVMALDILNVVMVSRTPPGTPMTANLLTLEDASFEAGTGTWSPASPGIALTHQNTQHLDGAWSMALTSIDGVNVLAANAQIIPVIPGQVYSGTIAARAFSTARTVEAYLQWKDKSGAFLSNSFGTGVADSSSGWVQATVTATAPANAAFVTLAVTVAGPPSVLETHYFDEAGLFYGTNTTWSAGGAGPIVKLEAVDGVAFALDVSGSTYTMTLQLSSVDTRNFFTLNNPIFGVLDSSKLGY